jgi:hypothetical protein
MHHPTDDQLTRAITSGLQAVWRTQGRHFVSFECDETAECDVFVQYLDGELNVSWPFDEDPAALLGVLPRGAFVLSWQPHGAVIVAVGDLLADEVAAFIAHVFRNVLALPSGALPQTRVLER